MRKKIDTVAQQQYFLSKHRRTITWIILWVILTLLVNSVSRNFLMSLANSTITILFAILLVSLVGKVFIKQFLDNGRNFLFYLSCAAIIIVFSVLDFMVVFVVDYYLLGYSEPIGFFVFPLIARLSIFSGIVFIYVVDHMQHKADENRRLSEQLKNEKLDMELHYLKSQINPHFLFNALNNVYSLVYTHDEKAPESVLALSEMLRYVMVDCQVETIPLKKEVTYISNYINFQIIHFEHRPNIIFEQEVENPNFMIPPMILQPIVENSFKYSRIFSDANGYISFLLVQNPKRMKFVAKNSVVNQVVPSQKTDGGIGLSNIRKRLELLYKQSFTLNAEQHDNQFVVELEIIAN